MVASILVTAIFVYGGYHIYIYIYIFVQTHGRETDFREDDSIVVGVRLLQIDSLILLTFFNFTYK